MQNDLTDQCLGSMCRISVSLNDPLSIQQHKKILHSLSNLCQGLDFNKTIN